MRSLTPWVAAAAALLMSTTGCTAQNSADPGATGSTTAAGPVTVDSCGRKVKFDAAPQRVLAVGSEAPSLLVAAGAGSKVTHYAGSLEVPFEAETKAVVKGAERVAEDSHKLSFETIVNTGVDVVIGTDITSGVDINALADRLDQAGVKLLTVSGYCAGIDGRSTGGVSGYDLIYRDIETYGRLFGHEETATNAIKGLRDRVTKATEQVKGKSGRRAVPLYTRTEGALGAYGGQSLVSEQMTLLGLKNVFADVPKRYFEPSTEGLVEGAPDLVFAIYLPTGSSALETEEDVIKALRARPELKGLKAIDDTDALLPLNYYFTSPGPLAVTGLEFLAGRLTRS